MTIEHCLLHSLHLLVFTNPFFGLITLTYLQHVIKLQLACMAGPIVEEENNSEFLSSDSEFHPDSTPWIPDFTPWIPDFTSWVLDSTPWIPDSILWIPLPGFQISLLGFWIPKLIKGQIPDSLT